MRSNAGLAAVDDGAFQVWGLTLVLDITAHPATIAYGFAGDHAPLGHVGARRAGAVECAYAGDTPVSVMREDILDVIATRLPFPASRFARIVVCHVADFADTPLCNDLVKTLLAKDCTATNEPEKSHLPSHSESPATELGAAGGGVKTGIPTDGGQVPRLLPSFSLQAISFFPAEIAATLASGMQTALCVTFFTPYYQQTRTHGLCVSVVPVYELQILSEYSQVVTKGDCDPEAIAEAVIRVLSECPIDLRAPLASNVMIIDTLALKPPGFCLSTEMSRILRLRSGFKFKSVLALVEKHFKVASYEVFPFQCWTGASLAAAAGIITKKFRHERPSKEK